MRGVCTNHNVLQNRDKGKEAFQLMIVFSVNLVNKNTKNVITNSKGKLSVSAGYESYTSSSIMYSNEPDPFLLMTK